MPSVVIPFSIDFIVLIVFLSYLIYGYFSGTHHQLRIFLTYVFPILILNIVAPFISTYVYVPLLQSEYFTIMSLYFSAFKYTATMVTAYVFSYSILFALLFLITRFIRKYFLNENINASLGKTSHFLGALIAGFNTYFIGYFLLIPLLTMNLILPSDGLTNFILNNPPPFSRTAAVTQNSTKINQILDRIYQFEGLLNVTNVDTYYDASFRPMIQTLFTRSDSYETLMMEEVYPELSNGSQILLEDAYLSLFGVPLSQAHYAGVSLVLLSASGDGLLYETLVKDENTHASEILAATTLVTQYEKDLRDYETNLELYEFDLQYRQFVLDALEYYEDSINYYFHNFRNIDQQNGFKDTFYSKAPEFNVDFPEGYVKGNEYINPLEPELTAAIIEAQLLVNTSLNYNNPSAQLAVIGSQLKAYEPILLWLNEYFDLSAMDEYDKSDVINIFKNSENLLSEVTDGNLKAQLTRLKQAVTAYDFFSAWMDCTITSMDSLSDEQLETHSCGDIDLTLPVDYSDTEGATEAINYLFESDHILKLMDQFNRDYTSGKFETSFTEDPLTLAIIDSTALFIDEFNQDYRSVAESVDPSLSMPIRIGISIIKKHVDLVQLFRTSPMTNALLSDMSGFCVGGSPSEINHSVTICNPVTGSDQLLSMALGSRYLLTQIMVKVFVLIDEDNQPVTYNYETMQTFLDDLNDLVTSQLIPVDVIKSMADQMAFAPLELGSNETLLDHLYFEDRISMEAIRLLVLDEYDLFSDEFQARARNLIR